MQIREKDFQAIMLLMRELWWYQAMRTNLEPQEKMDNYTGSSTSCLETGTPGINTMRTITVSQSTTTLTMRTIQYLPVYWTSLPLSSPTTKHIRTFLVSVNVGEWCADKHRGWLTISWLNRINLSDREFEANIKTVIVSVWDFITSLKLAITGHKPIFLSPRQTHKNFMS